MNAGIIGLGSQYGLGEKHAAVFDTRPEVDRISLCDTRREAAEKVAATLRKPTTIHTSIDELFSAGRVDVVSILTPDHLHRTHAEAQEGGDRTRKVVSRLAWIWETWQAMPSGTE